MKSILFTIYWTPGCGCNLPIILGLPVLNGLWWENFLGIARNMLLGGNVEFCMTEPDCFGKISKGRKWSK